MTTEDQLLLLLQIFDRKKLIIEQVKQQTELYNQHLASKLLLDGITPPSWLLTPNNSPASKELNREELISKILRPKAPPSVCFSSVHYYNNLIHNNGEKNDGFFMGTITSNKDLNIHDVPIVPTMSDEVGLSMTSPENHIDGRTSNICGAQHSLAKIQRSKSRQKAVEFRSSAKAVPKSGSNHENVSGPFSRSVILSSFATDESGKKSELQRLAEQRVTAESCKDSDMGESNSLKFSESNPRSESHVKAPDSVEGSPNIGCSADYFGDYVSSHGAKDCKGKSGSIFDTAGVVYADDSLLTDEEEDCLQSQCSELSASNKDHDFIAVDESMPVLEGFIVDAQEDCGEIDIATYGLDFDNLNLPSNAIERASILVEICRSASSETPLSSSTSAYDFQGTQHLYQSQIGFSDSLVNGVKDANERMLYSDCLPYSGSCYGWKDRNRNASPVGKLWERLSLQTGSSEKSLSSNPELACFTIEEDSCSTSADNEEMVGIVDDARKSFGSVSANHFDKRPPLKDITNVDQVPAASVQEVILTADGSDFVSTKSNVVEVRPSSYLMRNNGTRKNQSSFLGNSLVKKNQTQSIGGNCVMKSKESILNRSNKTTMPSKSRLKRLEQNPSMKESRTNNIISSVNSFLPLVQQKQAAPICAGKRDVKVKSLEAAEAAKRLEEKKVKERKMRKEAMKLERAKLKEKNLIQTELDIKKNIEDRKKKDADVIVKKRFREEEERKGKEQKRMRIEARQLQKEQEEKSRAEKAEKEKQRSKDEQMNSKKEYNETKKQHKMEILRGNDDEALKKSETKPNSTGLSMNYEEYGISGDSFEVGKGIHMMDKSPSNKDLIIPKIQGSSYEISPYQCSDDEDEEDVVLPTKKYIPPWASKSSLSLSLTLQQSMNPDVIFPPESCCSMDEVLLGLKI